MSSALPAPSSSGTSIDGVAKAPSPEATQPATTTPETTTTTRDAAFCPDTIKLEGVEDPRNWTSLTKWSITSVLSLSGFISPLGASIVIAGARGIDVKFHLHSRVLSLLPVSIYVWGLGLGPLVFAPLSELKGRQPVYRFSATMFAIFNVATALSPNYPALIILRFIAGIFGSTGPSLGGGTIGDMFGVKERARAQALYGLGPLMGPVVGNIIGGWIDQAGDHNWRWLLWTLTIMSGVIALITVVSLKETYGPVLLRRKRQRLAKEHTQKLLQASGDGTRPLDLAVDESMPSFKQRMASLKPSEEAKTKMQQAMSRPFRLLFTNPICAIMSCYLGFCYGIIFLFLVQHPLLYERRMDPDLPRPEKLPTYNWAPGLAGMTFIGLALGFLLATAVVAGYQNHIYEVLCQRNGVIPFVPAWMLGNKDAQAKAKARDTDQEIGADTLPRAEAVVPPPTPIPVQKPPPAAPFVKKGEPEYRLPLCLLGMFVFPVGLFIFGWAGEHRLHWAIPLIGSLFVGAGTILCFQAILVYLVDAFIPYSASATACAVLVRSVLAGVFPLFADSLYGTLGFGWGSSLLAFIGLAGVPVPIILFRYGGPLRRRFKFNG